MRPRDIYNVMRKDIIGQDEVLKYVSVAIFKHVCNEPFGNIIMIGNSGTGKTSIMRAMERMYAEYDFFEKNRVVVRMNANTLANEEGEVITGKVLFEALRDRAIQILGKEASPEKIKEYMEHGTVCIDEVDKISARIGGKSNVIGINIQQSLLTLMEDEVILFDTQIYDGEKFKPVQMEISTKDILFICGGAFEELYDQVYSRVFEEGHQDKLTKMVRDESGNVYFKQIFTLKANLIQEDMFRYGMMPQFLSRFDTTIVLNDLSPQDLKTIFMDTRDSVFRISRQFFKRFNIELSITEKAQWLVAHRASLQARVGARALKDVYGRIIKKFEFDPFETGKVSKLGENQFELTITERIVKDELGLK